MEQEQGGSSELGGGSQSPLMQIQRSEDQPSDTSSDEEARPPPTRDKVASAARCPDFSSDSIASIKKIAQEWEYYTRPYKYGNPFRTVDSNEVHALMHVMHSNGDVCDSEEPQGTLIHNECSDADLDDLSYCEFSELQLTLKSPVTSPKLGENETRAVTASQLPSRSSEMLPLDLTCPNISVNGDQSDSRESVSGSKSSDSVSHLVLSPATVSAGFSVHGSRHSGLLASSQNTHVVDPCHLPVLMREFHQMPADLQVQERHQPERLFHHITAEPQALSNTSEQFKSDQPRDWIPPPPGYNRLLSRPQQVLHITVQPAQTSVQLEPLELGHTISSSHLPLTLRETAPPTEVVLQPMALPQITRSQPGPSVSTVSKPVTSQEEWKDEPYRASTSQAATSFLPPPPSYSECMQQEMFKKDCNSSPCPGWKSDFYQDIQDQLNCPLFDVCANDSFFSKSTLERVKHYRNVPGLYSICDGPHFAQSSFDCNSRSDSREPLGLRVRGPPRWDTPPGDHQLLAFISCLFCWPIGLVAIYYSNRSHMLKSEGDYEQARTYARLAFIISIIGLCSGSFAYLIMLIYEKSV